ncbi:MAG: ABC transporter ATP-binding protein [Nitrososphaerota archaeon]
MAKLIVKNLRKVFGELEAVKGISFNVDEKETLCLLGPSGCGKTTTLRCIAGLETPTSGEIYINSTLINDLPPQKRGIGLVFQDYAVFPHMTVYDNLAFGLQVRKIEKSKIDAKVKEIARLLDLENVLQRYAKRLSLSEIQRVAIGRAIAVEPEILLLDEPLSNLDARTREKMRTELKEIQMKVGITSVYVTHDQLEAMTLADRIAVMNNGLIEQIGKPTEIYDNPKTLFVARFIGTPSMNFIDCSFIEKNGKAIIDANEFYLDVTNISSIIKEKSTTSELILGCRSEDIIIETEKISPDSIGVEVQFIENLGAKSIYHLGIGEKRILVKTHMIPGIRIGSKVWILFNKNKIHLFDKKTGLAII